ncbi:hypothetical protein GIB67_010983 [Kingdonia uniflora]|uniref:GIY-YIG domain-containing protein n=1 Tax=Kingdonia uniflora TaxID=39325 RepID=A0A7J7MMA6_9MAGN|nr:hypothetical protein GIB67_010983 [Kingdonia uniflora]
MRKRKQRSKPQKMNREEEISKEGDQIDEGKEGFFACYLLTSLNPRFKGHCYIGFTVNPRRRIRQQNGEIGRGALRSKKRRPWEMILCIHGFRTNVTALQHPRKSLAVRKAATNFKSLFGIANNIKLAYTMLTLSPWQSLKLTVNYFSTKYMKDSAGCPSLPKQMRVQVFPMEELPCYTGINQVSDEDANHEDNSKDQNDVHGNADDHLRMEIDDVIRLPRDNISGHLSSIIETADDQSRLMEDCDIRQLPRDPLSPREEGHRLAYHLVDSPKRTPSSSLTNVLNHVGDVVDRDPSWLIEETNGKLASTTNLHSETLTCANRDQPPYSNDIQSSPEGGFVRRDDTDPFGQIEESSDELSH